MQKNYVSKLGIITSIFYNCSLPETNQQISDEKFISLKKDLKKLLSQNVLNNGHHQRQIYGMQTSIKDLKNDVSNLTQLLNSQKYVNDQLLQNIKEIKGQIDELKTLPGTVDKINKEVEKLKTLPETVKEIKGQIDELKTLPETVKGIKDQVDKLEKALEDALKKQKQLETELNKLQQELKAEIKTLLNSVTQALETLKSTTEQLNNTLTQTK